MRVGVFGATGQVGGVMRKLLAERNYSVDEIRYFTSERPASKVLFWGDREAVIEDIAKADFHGIDVVPFFAGGGISKQWAPEIARVGATVIGNSSAWRMDPRVPLTVSQANPEDADKVELGIIANPNCTTVAAMPMMKPLHDAVDLEAMRITTFQAVSGSGISGVRTLAEQIRQIDSPQVLVHDGSVLVPSDLGPYAKPIALNTLPQVGSFVDDGEGKAGGERKLHNELCKILYIPGLLVADTCARMPIFTGCSLSIHARFSHPIIPDEIRSLLTGVPGVELPETSVPLGAVGKDPSYVDRIRRDQSVEGGIGLVLFVGNDNLRKGVTLNVTQVVKLLVQ